MNQGRLLLAAFAQFQAEFRKDPTALFQWIAVGMRNVATDVPLNELLTLAFAASEIGPKRITNLVAVGSIGTAGGASIVNLPSRTPCSRTWPPTATSCRRTSRPTTRPPDSLGEGADPLSVSSPDAPHRRRARLGAGDRRDRAPRAGRRARETSHRDHAEGRRRRPRPLRSGSRSRPKARPYLVRTDQAASTGGERARRDRGRSILTDLYTEGFLDPANWEQGRTHAFRAFAGGAREQAEAHPDLLTAGARAGDRYDWILPVSGRIATRILLDRSGRPALLCERRAVLRGRPRAEPVTLRSNGQFFFERIDGSWKIVSFHVTRTDAPREGT